MSTFSDFYTYMKAQTPLTDQLGTGVNFRFYLSEAPAVATFPHVIWNVVSSPDFNHMLGESGVAEYGIQIDSIALSQKGAWDIAELIRAELNGFRGFLNGAGSTDVRKCFLKNENWDRVPKGDGSQVSFHRVIQDFDLSVFRTAVSP